MSTKTGKTFGLALIMAVGILAVMFALGTFNAQKAGADDHGGVTLSTSTTDPSATDAELTVTFTSKSDISTGDGAIVITLPSDVTTAADTTIKATLIGAGEGDAKQDDSERKYTVAGGDVSVSSGVVTINVPANIPGNNLDPSQTDAHEHAGIKGGTEVTVTIPAFTVTKMVRDITAQVSVVTARDDSDVATSTDDLGTSAALGLGVVLETNTEAPGATARVIVEIATANGVALDAGTLEEIVIDMGKFGLPASIDEADVSLRGIVAGGTESRRGTPASVTISGSKVTIIVDDMDQSDDSETFEALSPHFRVIFSTGAGITIPAIAGDYSVKIVQVTDKEAEDTEFAKDDGGVASNAITVAESLSIKPDKGSTGTEVTVTGKGFGNDITSLFIDTVRQIDDPDEDAEEGAMIKDPDTPDGKPENDEHEIATNIDVDKGTFSYTFTVDSNFSGTSYINVLKTNGVSYRDGEPTDDNVYPTFTVTGKMSLSTDAAQPGDEITVTLANFSEGKASATIGGVKLFTSTTTDGSSDIDAEIPVTLAVGKHQVKVTVVPDDGGDSEIGTANITIEGLPLTVSPASAVPGQEITIKGSGFTKRAAIDVIEIGGVEATLPDTDILVNSSGNFVANIEVPEATRAEGDDVLVEVRETGTDADNPGNNRQGVARITIPKETLMLNPDTSRPDTTVVASGTGYVAGAVVEIKYDGKTVVSVNADSTGNWTKAFVVPTDKPVGNEYTVQAVGDEDVAPKSASETHTIPGGGLTVSPLQGRPGASISVTGDGFTAYRPVSSITIGGLSVLTGIVNTDEDGDFSATILLPALPEGTHSLVVKVGDDTEGVVFTVGEAGPATLATAEVFKDLIDAGNLERVYHYVNATATWLVYDPRPDFAEFNDYTEATSGQAVWVKVTNAAQFQGEPLFAGWNLIVLR